MGGCASKCVLSRRRDKASGSLEGEKPGLSSTEEDCVINRAYTPVFGSFTPGFGEKSFTSYSVGLSEAV